MIEATPDNVLFKEWLQLHKGNILTVSNNGTLQYSYTYDSLNQLTSDVDHTTNTHNEYVYDKGGNMTSRTSYVLDENGEKQNENTIEYEYSSKNFKDRLTKFDGQNILIGWDNNPLGYRDRMTLGWKNGRQLTGVSTGYYHEGNDETYTYDDAGRRTGKKRVVSNILEETTKYYYNGDKLVAQESEGKSPIYFFYDDNDNVVGFKTNDITYYYVKNIQNDIIGILDKDGNQVVSYTYDAWGKPLSTTGEMADTIGNLNPLRYRGYYYDKETGFYYLNSRYYDPVVCRFIIWDDVDVLDEDQDSLIENNLFAYCLNNPVKHVDSNGKLAITITAVALATVALAAVGAFAVGVVAVSSPNFRKALNQMCANLVVSSTQKLKIISVAVAYANAVYLKAKSKKTKGTKKQSKSSGKAKADDAPSWAKGKKYNKNKSADSEASRVLDEKYGKGKWNKGARSEFSQIKKWLQRSKGYK